MPFVLASVESASWMASSNRSSATWVLMAMQITVALPTMIPLLLLASVSASAEEDSEQADSQPPSLKVECKEDDKPCTQRPPAGYFTVGVGYSPDEGFIGEAGLGKDRLFGGGQSFRLTTTLSERREELVLEHKVPTLFGSGLDAQLSLYSKKKRYWEFERQGVGGALELSRNLSSKLSAHLGFRVEDVTSSANQVNATALKTDGAGLWQEPASSNGLLTGLSAGLRYDDIDRKTLRGSQAEISLERNDPRLGSDFNLSRVSVSGRHRQHLLGPFDLSLRGSADAIWSNDISPVAISERLQWDGHADLRGFALGSLGPSIGGNLKLKGGAEIEFPIFPKIGLYGNAFYDVAVLRNDDAVGHASLGMGQSVGGGLSLRTPIGQFAATIAYPLGGEESGDEPIILFSLGGIF